MLEIEAYREQIGNELWLAGGESNGKTVKCGREFENKKKYSQMAAGGDDVKRQLKTIHDDVKTAEIYGPYFGMSFEKGSHT